MGSCCGCTSGPKKPNELKYRETNIQLNQQSYTSVMPRNIQQPISINQIMMALNALNAQDSTTRQVRFTLSNRQRQTLNLQSKTSILALKQRIYEQYNILRPQLMVFIANSRILQNYENLRQIEYTENRQIHIIQRKAEIWEIGLKYNRTKEDPISAQMGVVSLQCKHQISRGGLIATIQHQINALEQQFIQCPQLGADGNICRRKINDLHQQLIAGYTQNEWNEVANKKSINYLKKNTTTCPSCRNSIDKKGLKTKKTICPTCNSNFCFQCAQFWTAGNNTECQSARCFTIGRLIQNAPWDRVFTMNNAPHPVKVPNLRACPKCKQLIMNTANCKHTTCICGCNFCFVCLSVRQNGWKCGSYNEYCKTGVAPNQKLNLLIQPKSG